MVFVKKLLTFLGVSLLLVLQVRGQDIQTSNLPLIIIDTQGFTIKAEPKILASMAIIDNPNGVNHIDDLPNGYNGLIAIEQRGSSSAMFPKKQYGFELRDANNQDVKASLLGLPAEEDWILYAAYNDKALMRDVLAYKMARDMGRYASRSRYCEVIINGEYLGIYILFEKIKVDKNRVDIGNVRPEDNAGDELTGGYIIKVDKTTGGTDTGWYSDYTPPNRRGGQMINFLYHDPDPSKITLTQKQYIQEFIRQFEDVLAGDNFRDREKGYRRYIDVGSFIDFMILNEATKNGDGYRISTFMHKKKDSEGGKLFMGPAWDFNLAFGNITYCVRETPEGWVYQFNDYCPDDYYLIPFWWERLMEDGSFQRQLAIRWAALRTGPLSLNHLHDRIDSIATHLTQGATARNFTKWPILGEYVWPNAFIGQTYQEEVDWLRDWVTNRITWLDSQIAPMITAAEDEVSLVDIYPNPSAAGFNVVFGRANNTREWRIDLLDMLGRVVESASVPHSESRVTLGQALPAGMYHYRVLNGNKTAARGQLIKH